MKVLVLLSCAFALVGCAIGASNKYWNLTDIDILKTGLLDEYDKLSRPSDSKTATKLTVGISIINFDLVESAGILETHAWLRMNWTDSKLVWDPSEHNGIAALRLAADEIWQPDLTVYNSAERQIMDHFEATNKIAYSYGGVLWVPTAKFETYCKMDLKLWPFDEQTCTIKLGSWTYDSLNIKLSLFEKPIEMEHFLGNSEWEVTKTSAEHHQKIYPCCPEPYEDVTFDFTMLRRSAMYKALAVVPAVVVVFMVLISFWLPPKSGEKFLINSFATVIVIVVLMHFSEILPTNSNTSPIIVKFLTNTLYLLAVSFVISAIVINMSRNTYQSSVPKFIKTIFLNGVLEKIFACAAKSADKDNIEDGKPNVSSNDWTRVAVIIDRIAFVIYVIIFICMAFCHEY